MHYKNKRLILAILLIIGFVLFYRFGVEVKRTGLSYTKNCTDVAGEYEPCEVHDVQYGIPFTYAEGRPFVPGNFHSRDNVKVLPLFGNAVVWILLLPITYLLAGRKKK